MVLVSVDGLFSYITKSAPVFKIPQWGILFWREIVFIKLVTVFIAYSPPIYLQINNRLHMFGH